MSTPAAVPWRLLLGAGEEPTPARRARASWRPRPSAGALNMAVDHALLEAVAAGAPPTLRFYRWHPACLSLGRNQTARGRVHAARARALGIDIVRRPTGGTAVLHHEELTYSVTLGVGVLGRPRATFLAVHRALAAGLGSLGVSVRVASIDALPGARGEAGGAVCFRVATAGELQARGRKLVGSAQRSERRTLLQHGSILLDGTQREVAALFDAPDPERRRGAMPSSITLRELTGGVPPLDRLVHALAAGFEGSLGICLAPGSLAPTERDRVRALTERYSAQEWTWRR